MFSYCFYHIYCSHDMGELKYTTQGTFGGMNALIWQSPIEYRTQYEQEYPSDNTKPEDNVSHRKAV